jgi:TRAP-type mannitol/chloroaromatic compound transport system permease large subunit
MVGLLLVLTGLPAWAILVGVAGGGAGVGLATGAFGAEILQALPNRLLGLLESDVLQAMPLYAFMGVLLNRLTLAETCFKVGRYTLRRTPAAAELSGLGLGILLAPMNGSVGANVAMLGRVVLPRLEAAGVDSGRAAAQACVAGTFGIVVPPSLVLLLLGDAMMRAHTEALNLTHAAVQVINTQNVFHGALPAAGLFLIFCLLMTWVLGRRGKEKPIPRPSNREVAIAALTVTAISSLLAMVATGYLYAVEAAAVGGVLLFGAGFATGTLRSDTLGLVLRESMEISGSLFALLLGATTFTLILRAFGTDQWMTNWFGTLDSTLVLPTALAVLALSAFVLDAFEIIFVIVPIVIPPLLMRVPDATWVAVLALLVLQISFLLPPLGYALMMIRQYLRKGISSRAVAGSITPYLLALTLVFGLILAYPGIVSSGPISLQVSDSSATTGESPDLAELLQADGSVDSDETK